MMKYRHLAKIVLSVIFAFILALVMIATPQSIVSADQVSKAPSNLAKTDCNSEKIDVLQNLVDQGVQSSALYLTLGDQLKGKNRLSQSEAQYQKVIDLIEKAGYLEDYLAAKAEIINIQFLLKKISSDQANLLLKQIKSGYESLRGIKAIECKYYKKDNQNCKLCQPGTPDCNSYMVRGRCIWC